MTNPPDAPAAPSAHGAALSRQLGDFLIELSIALHKHAMYPDGHPSLAPACVQVARRLSELLSDRPSLSLGVARTRLVIEGVATDPKNPVLRDLASRLHRHQLGAVTLRRGVPADELQSFLRTVAAEPERTGEPLGPASKDRPPPWFHVRVHALSYDQLRFAEGEDHVETAAISRAEQLWIGLAQAALATAEETVDEDEAAKAEPAVVAKAIGEHQRGSAYDQVIVGYLLQLAEELRSSQGKETLALKRRLSELVGNLDRPTLGTLLNMGGDRQQRRQFLLDASHTLTVDAVLDVVQAASNEQEGQLVSQSMLRMLQKLAKHADSSAPRRRVEADVAIREQVAELIRDWTLRDPNPDPYRKALETMSASTPLFAVSPDQRFQVDPQRIVQMALESNVTGDLLDRSVRELIDRGQLSWLLETLNDADAAVVTKAIEEQVASSEMLASLLAADRLDVATLDQLLARVGAGAAEVMMDVLAEANSGHTRRILLDRLIALGPEVGPLAIARLADPRWFVQRNMLVILGSLPERPPGFNPADFLQHRDPRVRREAIRILLRDADGRERAVCHALADEDPRTVQLGLNAALERCPETAIPLVVSRTGSDVPADLRTLAIKVLGSSGQRTALDTLLRIVEPRRGLFRSRRRAKSPEYLAALAALQQFAEHPSARRALDHAANSSDPDVVRAATSVQA